MDISTFTPDKQVKLQYWPDVIRQCRDSGLTNQAWCEQHDIYLTVKSSPQIDKLTGDESGDEKDGKLNFFGFAKRLKMAVNKFHMANAQNVAGW